MTDFIIVSFACAAISFTISWTSIFRSFRELVSRIHPKVDELVHCPWCVNHYVVLLFLLFSGFKKAFLTYELIGMSLANLVITWFAVVGLGGVIHFVLLRAYEPVAKQLVQRQLDKLRKKDEEFNEKERVKFMSEIAKGNFPHSITQKSTFLDKSHPLED